MYIFDIYNCTIRIFLLLKFNFYKRKRSNYLNFVFVKDDIKRVKLYKIERLINKRKSVRDNKYLLY